MSTQEQAAAKAGHYTLSRARLREIKAASKSAPQPLVDKVPPIVNAGSVQDVRAWIRDNAAARRAVKRGSLGEVELALGKQQAWWSGRNPNKP